LKLYHILPIPNLLAVASKSMWVAKVFSNKILQFLTGGAG